MILFFPPGRTMLKIYQQRSGVCFVVGISMQGSMDRSRQFRFHLRIGKFHSIVTRRSRFFIFREMTAISVPGTGTCTGNRHYQNITQVHTSCSIQMRLRESPNQRILIGILGTIAPADCTRHRAALDHSERITSPRKGMPIIGRTDECINVSGIIFCFRFFCRRTGRIEK